MGRWQHNFQKINYTLVAFHESKWLCFVELAVLITWLLAIIFNF